MLSCGKRHANLSSFLNCFLFVFFLAPLDDFMCSDYNESILKIQRNPFVSSLSRPNTNTWLGIIRRLKMDMAGILFNIIFDCVNINYYLFNRRNRCVCVCVCTEYKTMEYGLLSGYGMEIVIMFIY